MAWRSRASVGAIVAGLFAACGPRVDAASESRAGKRSPAAVDPIEPVSSVGGRLDAPVRPAEPSAPFAFGELVHVAGKGEHDEDGHNGWKPEFEGALATDVELSHPYFAVADRSGAVFIADKDAHAVRRVTPDGHIFTWLGMSRPGDGPDTPTSAADVAVRSPNGLWLGGDGVLYVLDLGNGKVRRVDTSGTSRTLAVISGGIDTGRGLWVAADERTVYVAAKSELKRWTPNGVHALADGFISLGNILIEPDGTIVLCDRGGNRVWRRTRDGQVAALAGNGLDFGGTTHKALETTLLGPRGIVALDHGRYVIATHRGRRLWGLDSSGELTLLLDGETGAGLIPVDPGAIGVIRGLSRSPAGDLWLTHGDGGQVHVLKSVR